MQDAFNLGLEARRRHQRPCRRRTLLDTYEQERRPVTEELLRSVRAQCAVQFNFTEEGVAFKRMFEQQPAAAAEVNRRIALELNGLTRPYPSPPGSHPLDRPARTRPPPTSSWFAGDWHPPGRASYCGTSVSC